MSPELADRFKAAFRHHPAGVALISADTPDGPVGLTASSVASVSVAPVALAFSVTSRTGSARGILDAESFVVHLLGEHQLEVARAFATPGAPRFTAEQGWSRMPGGEPWLPDAPFALRCTHLDRIEVGPSVLIVAEVHAVAAGEPAGPLAHRDRAFHRLGEHSLLG